MGKGKPAPVIYSHQHGDVLLMAYDVGTGYDVYAVKVSAGRQRFVGSYRTKYFAKRRCRRGAAFAEATAIARGSVAGKPDTQGGHSG